MGIEINKARSFRMKRKLTVLTIRKKAGTAFKECTVNEGNNMINNVVCILIDDSC